MNCHVLETRKYLKEEAQIQITVLGIFVDKSYNVEDKLTAL